MPECQNNLKQFAKNLHGTYTTVLTWFSDHAMWFSCGLIFLFLALQSTYIVILVRHVVHQVSLDQLLHRWALFFWNLPLIAPKSLIYWHYALSCIPFAIVSLLLLTDCAIYYHPWSNGNRPRKIFRWSELLQKAIRISIYVVCAIYLYLAYFYPAFIENRICIFNATFISIPLFICILQSTFRLTFRRTANFAFAAANTIVYLVLLDTACINYPILGLLGDFAVRHELESILSHLASVIGVGIVITIVVTVLQESINSLLAAITSHHPANLSQRRRRNRRRLLTHWHYKKEGTISSWEDTLVVMLGIEVFVFIAATVIVLLRSGYIDTLAEGTAPADERSILPFGMYPLSLAILIFIPAIMSVWTVSDERLIQSEYTYLTLHSSHLRPKDVTTPSNHWMDFCQVLVNLYSNVSGVESEDRGFHKFSDLLIQLHRYLGQNNACANSKFFSDILSFKGNINAKLLREANHEDSDEERNYQRDSMIQRARDLQFASDLLKVMDEHYDRFSKTSPSVQAFNKQNPLYLIENLANAFFEGRDHVWGQRFGAYNLSAHDGIKLLKMDVLIHIMRRESTRHCGLSWLGCNCSNISIGCSRDISNPTDLESDPGKTYIENRMELILTFPFIVISCYKNRWNDNVDNFPLEEDFYRYYLNLIDKKIHFDASAVGFDEFLFYVIKSVNAFLVESEENTSLIATIRNDLRFTGLTQRHPYLVSCWVNEEICSQIRNTRVLSSRALNDKKAEFSASIRNYINKKSAPAEIGDIAQRVNDHIDQVIHPLYCIAYALFYSPGGGNNNGQ